MPYQFDRTVRELRATPAGKERDMYARVRDILIHTFGHSSALIVTDSSLGSGRGAPDLLLKAPIGLNDRTGRPLVTEWAVVEVKDERDTFANPARRESIFTEKSKDIGLTTEWFIMIDPEQIVARPVTMRSQLHFSVANDICLRWDGLTESAMRTALFFLDEANAGVSGSLAAFRPGDATTIASIKLRLPKQEEDRLSPAQRERFAFARRDFFDVVRQSTSILQQACIDALKAQYAEVERIIAAIQEFDNQWDGYTLEFSPFRLRGHVVLGPEDARIHDRQVARLRQILLANASLSKLAVKWLPAYRERVGSDRRDDAFAVETANLVLARILMLRFFEDHGFLGDKKYVCNGGVAAFQSMMRYFGDGYTTLLRAAYEKASLVYAAVFDEMDLDWVLGVENEQLSRAIELSMMWLSRFDFTTVRGDILTGIYDSFLDRKQRKDLGEFYTPPSIARYMIGRLNLRPGDSVFDPACGSGTFLIEAYEHLVGDDIVHGRAGYDDAVAALAHIAGNDISPFSSVIAQVQMLWHLLALRDDLARHGFPEIRIAERHNSLLPERLEFQGTLFGEINRPIHAAVIGNPPYVRPERGMQSLSVADARLYDDIGGADKDLFGLFVYKAMAGWCRPPKGETPAGKLAFVIPLAFCDNDDNERLRRLFAVGGRFRIVEIVDLELIATEIFDADVVPIILIAENSPATVDDTVTIRIAGPACVVDASAREFDLGRASKEVFPYRSIWTRDGRILTKLTARRKELLDQLGTHATFDGIAQRYWSGYEGSRIARWQLDKPRDMRADGKTPDGVRWEESSMIRMGCAFRNAKPTTTDSSRRFDFYKGENVVVGMIDGTPAETGIDIDGISDPSVWRYRDILPERGFAVHSIALTVYAAPFDPRRAAWLNTAILFFPRQELAHFPFDLVLASRVYTFYYALYLRTGVLFRKRSHIYPRNLRLAPL